MHVDGLRAEFKLERDLLARHTLDDHLDDLSFARCQTIDPLIENLRSLIAVPLRPRTRSWPRNEST